MRLGQTSGIGKSPGQDVCSKRGLAKPYTLRCAHLALHTLCLKFLLFCPFLAVGYVMVALFAVSDRSLLQILQLVLEDRQGHLISIQAINRAVGTRQHDSSVIARKGLKTTEC